MKQSRQVKQETEKQKKELDCKSEKADVLKFIWNMAQVLC
jgi:hypothetical protein